MSINTLMITPKNFKVKAKAIEFQSVEFMSADEKQKIYKAFVRFLNNHFKKSFFVKPLYVHLHTHCGFIAHYNIHGFYEEYFVTAEDFHQDPTSENFMRIYKEINEASYGLGEFYRTILSNQNWGGYRDYKDLDDAIKEAFGEYLSTWKENIHSALRDRNKKKEKNKKPQENKQSSLFDFAA